MGMVARPGGLSHSPLTTFSTPCLFHYGRLGDECVVVGVPELAMIVQVSTGMLAAAECRGASEITDALERDCFIITEYKFV